MPSSEDEAKILRERAEAGRTALQRLAQEDIDVFERLGVAYKLPRTTDADAASRRAAIQTVTRQATEVPLRMTRALVDLVPLCAPLARHGSRLAVSDVGVAALLIKAAVPAALLTSRSTWPRWKINSLFARPARRSRILRLGLKKRSTAF